MLQHSFGPYSTKKLPLQSKQHNRPEKHLLVIGVTAKAKYDREWFIGELVAHNKEIDQWTIIIIR